MAEYRRAVVTERPGWLRVPNEFRYAQALALSVDGEDALGILLEVGALQHEDLLAGLRVSGALTLCLGAELRAELEHAAAMLMDSLAGTDGQSFVAYELARLGWESETVVETLARLGVALELGCRPWSDEVAPERWETWRGWVKALYLAKWREWVRELLALGGVEMMGLPAPRVIGHEAPAAAADDGQQHQ